MQVYIKTHGCTNNYHETEIMMGLLKEHNFSICSSPEEADVIVVNVCTVKGTETSVKTIKDFKSVFPEKKLVIAGCISKDIIPEIRQLDDEAPLLSTNNLTEIVPVIEELGNGNVLEALTREKLEKVSLPASRINKVIGIVPISSGCVDHCTYCSVKQIKGNVYSYPAEKIVAEVKKCLKEGCKEIWLTSQDNGCYGLDNGDYKLIGLIQDILKLKGDFKVRLGMINPHHALKMVDGLISIYQDDKMFKFAHLPVESGNNEVLSDMKRKYNIFEFKELTYALRRFIPGIILATDMIVGFPTESEQQFHDSLQLVSEVKPEILNISRFHPRPNTKAAKMKQNDPGRVKERSRDLASLYIKIMGHENQKCLGAEYDVIIDNHGKDGAFTSRNNSYRQVVLHGNFVLGQKVRCRITSATAHYLVGEAIAK